MKRSSIIMLAILMVIGFATVASAAPTLSFDIDFYGGSTSLAQGVMDTGSTIDLDLGDLVNVGIYFSLTEEGVVGGGFDLDYDSDGMPNLAAAGLSIPMPFVDTGMSEIIPEHVRVEAWAFPPGSFVGPGDDFLLADFSLECLDPGLDELWLNDFDTMTAQWVTETGLVLDDQMNGIYLASVNNKGNDVPIPSSLLLIMSGLFCLIGICRKKSF